ncbi:MAG: hypothetical protein A2V88_07340, partial [Elusimicrobia bacterium RBG_16_66_12]
MSRRRALILLSAAALFWLSRHAYYVGFFNDDAYYLIGAKSLLAGRYAEIHSPGAPPLVDYLPGWPLLLAPILALTGGSLEAAQLWALALLTAGLAFFASALERESGPETADMALACAAASPLLTSTAATLLSDGPMLFCAGAALAALPRLWGRRDSSAWVGFGLMLGLAALVRPTGLALPMAISGVLFLDGRRREAALIFCAAVAAFASWLVRNSVVSGAGWNHWREAISAARGGGIPFFANAWACVDTIFGRSLLRPPVPASFLEVGSVMGGLGLMSVGLRGLRTPSGKAAALFLMLFIAPHLLWAKSAARYFIPLVPVAAWLILRGAASLSPRASRAVAALSVAFSLLASAGVVRASWSPMTERSVPPAEVASWLRAHSRPGSLLAAEYDARWHLLTGLPAVHIPYDARTPQKLSAFLETSGVSFVVVEDTALALRPAGGAYAVP